MQGTVMLLWRLVMVVSSLHFSFSWLVIVLHFVDSMMFWIIQCMQLRVLCKRTYLFSSSSSSYLELCGLLKRKAPNALRFSNLFFCWNLLYFLHFLHSSFKMYMNYGYTSGNLKFLLFSMFVGFFFKILRLLQKKLYLQSSTRSTNLRVAKFCEKLV